MSFISSLNLSSANGVRIAFKSMNTKGKEGTTSSEGLEVGSCGSQACR